MTAPGGESHLLHGYDSHRRADPLIRSANAFTTTCGYAYRSRLRSLQQPPGAPQEHETTCAYRLWSYQGVEDICIPVQGLCLCIQTASAWWVRSYPSSKHLHGFAIGSCPAQQGGGCLCGPQKVDLSRDRRSAGPRDLPVPHYHILC